MITDTLNNIELYKQLLPQVDAVKEFVSTHQNVDNLESGKYLIDADNVFALVQQYVTKPSNEVRWETHREYIDIQFILDGEEAIGYAPFGQLKLVQDFEKGSDNAFHESLDSYTSIRLSKGMFAVFFPGEGHLPCCINKEATYVTKIVFKIKFSSIKGA